MTSLVTLSTGSAAEGSSAGKVEHAYLGGGCFWCVEAAYELLPGVKAAVSGYAGGKTKNPSYEEISGGRTGHAEVVRIDFDPSVVTYRQIVDFFWDIHDPTTLNRQGADVGPQYRSIILFANEAQRHDAEQSLQAAQGPWGGRIVTQLVALETFYEAEKYHQDYYEKNPNAGYCRVVIKPKLDKLKKQLQTKE